MSNNLRVSPEQILHTAESSLCVQVVTHITPVIDKDNLFLPQEILYCYGETMSTVGVISKVFTYLDRRPACQKEGELAPEKLEGRVVFQDVTFTYPSAPQNKPALKVNV